MCGEMGRTPKISPIAVGGKNASGEVFTPGRHHWGDVFPCFFAGGGIQPGQVIGTTSSVLKSLGVTEVKSLGFIFEEDGVTVDKIVVKDHRTITRLVGGLLSTITDHLKSLTGTSTQTSGTVTEELMSDRGGKVTWTRNTQVSARESKSEELNEAGQVIGTTSSVIKSLGVTEVKSLGRADRRR